MNYNSYYLHIPLLKYKKYIKDSINISEIGLGAWQLGQNSGWKSMTEIEAIKLVHKSLDFGINFFDTAPNYGHGTGEERLGKAIKAIDRSKIVINTKFGHTDTGTLNFSSDYIRESLEGSLKRLQVDYVDSLIIHNPPSEYFDDLAPFINWKKQSGREVVLVDISDIGNNQNSIHNYVRNYYQQNTDWPFYP